MDGSRFSLSAAARSCTAGRPMRTTRMRGALAEPGAHTQPRLGDGSRTGRPLDHLALGAARRPAATGERARIPGLLRRSQPRLLHDPSADHLQCLQRSARRVVGAATGTIEQEVIDLREKRHVPGPMPRRVESLDVEARTHEPLLTLAPPDLACNDSPVNGA